VLNFHTQVTSDEFSSVWFLTARQVNSVLVPQVGFHLRNSGLNFVSLLTLGTSGKQKRKMFVLFVDGRKCKNIKKKSHS